MKGNRKDHWSDRGTAGGEAIKGVEMKYSIEEIKTLLEGITPGEWEVRQQIPYSQALLVFAGRFENNRTICRGEWTTRQGDNDLEFIAAAPTIIHDLLAEVERLRENIEQLQVQLAACGVAAMCNTAQSRGQQECVVGDYGWSQSYQDVVNAVGREIALRDQLARHLADQELLVGQERRRVARECAEIADSNADEYQDEMNIYPDGDPKVEVYEKAMVACEYIAKEIRIRYGVEG